MSLERLAYDAEAGTVTYTSDKSDGPTAGPHTFEATAFIAHLVDHIPDKGQVLHRYYGYYANRTRGERRKAEQAAEAAEAANAERCAVASSDPELPLGGVTIVEPADFSHVEARRRWAELIRLIYEVDPLVCPKCRGTMRVIARRLPVLRHGAPSRAAAPVRRRRLPSDGRRAGLIAIAEIRNRSR